MLTDRICAALAAGLALVVIAGCAASPNATEIVQWQQQERDQLEARGFPAYGPPGG
jgi:hypothetical protein